MTPATRPIRAAFSLVELVIVMVVMAVFAAVAVPRVSGSVNRYRADLLAARVAADLVRLQRQARKTSATLSMKFDAASELYATEGLADPDRPGATLVVAADQEPYSGDLVSAAFGTPIVPIVQFNGHGLPAAAGTVVIGVKHERRQIDINADGVITVSTLASVQSMGEGIR
jgi:prepilin-type N-terminal cleavage/methylation domain-containing protein